VVQQTLQCIIQVGERNMLAQPPDWSIKVEVAEVKTSKTSRYKAIRRTTDNIEHQQYLMQLAIPK